MRVARAALGAIEPSLRFHHIVDRQRVTGARRARGAGWTLTAARTAAQDSRGARFTSGSSFRCTAKSWGKSNDGVCVRQYSAREGDEWEKGGADRVHPRGGRLIK